MSDAVPNSGISVLTEDAYIERMAHAIYVNHKRREVSFIRAWKTLPEDRKSLFRSVASDAILDLDLILARI